MSTLAVRAGEAHDLAATVALMALGFPGAHKFSEAFLRWQYYANPLGALPGRGIDPAEANSPAPERVKMWTALDEPPPT